MKPHVIKTRDLRAIHQLRLSANLAAISYYRERRTREAKLRLLFGSSEGKRLLDQSAEDPLASPFEWYACDHGRVRYVVVQGTRDRMQWKINLDIDPITLVGTTKAHRGAFHAALSLANALSDSRALASLPPSHSLGFVGHSMGGSVAMLAAMILLLTNAVSPLQISFVHMFGCPAVLHPTQGSSSLIRDFQHVVQHVVVSHDVVPRLLSANYKDLLRFSARWTRKFHYSTRPYKHVGDVMLLEPSRDILNASHPMLEGPGLYTIQKRDLDTFLDHPPILDYILNQDSSLSLSNVHSVVTYARALGNVARRKNFLS